MQSTTPIFYMTKTGKRGVGYDAQLLPMVAEVYLKLRDHYLEQGKPIPKTYEHIVKACDIVLMGSMSLPLPCQQEQQQKQDE